jgi:DNA-binding transcriptional ArsR family regulator
MIPVRESKVKREKNRKKEKLGEGQMRAVAGLFAILSEPSRLRILQLLQDGPASVGEVVAALEMKQANASKQLGILHQAGVVARERAGNSAIYSIRMPLVFDLCGLVCNGLRAEAEAKFKLLA